MQGTGLWDSIVAVRLIAVSLLVGLGMIPMVHGGDMLAVFQKSCIQCHGKDGKVKGKVNLLEIKDLDHLKKDPDLLQELIDGIDFEEMPPEDEPQLDPKERKQLLADLEELRAGVLSKEKTYPVTPIRRMNRFQYQWQFPPRFDPHPIGLPIQP